MLPYTDSKLGMTWQDPLWVVVETFTSLMLRMKLGKIRVGDEEGTNEVAVSWTSERCPLSKLFKNWPWARK